MKDNPFELKGRVAIVTGGGRGIGKTISAILAETGAKVVVADVDEASALQTAKELNGQSGNVIGSLVDVGQEESVSNLIQLAFKTFGQIDILVNNAGIMFRTRLMDISVDEWEKTLNINLTGAFLCTKAVLLGLTRAAAKEVAPLGITVNAICPGLIETKMALETTTQMELQQFLDSFPIPRLGSPEEIAHLVVFLCSDSAAYITGASLDINGGDLMI